MKKKKIEIGEFALVENKTARQGANSEYMYGVVMERGGGKLRHLMLTTREYAAAISRALKNPEDCIDRHTVLRPKKKKKEKGFMAWLRRKQA